jgi:hypothetical protein
MSRTGGSASCPAKHKETDREYLPTMPEPAGTGDKEYCTKRDVSHGGNILVLDSAKVDECDECQKADDDLRGCFGVCPTACIGPMETKGRGIHEELRSRAWAFPAVDRIRD